MDRHVLELTATANPRVAIIPTAAARENPGLAASNGVRHFSGLGADAYSVDVVRRENAENPRIVAQLDGANVIYFTGGSPEHLHSVLAGSAFLAAVAEACDAGAIWAGSSAGAMVLGSVMRRPSSGSPVSPALGMVANVMVLPHHERSDPEETIRTLRDNVPGDHTVLGVDARTGCLGGAGEWKVVGSGKVTLYQGGSWQIFESGEQLPSGVLG
jgi:cyanophycinase